MLRSLTLAGAAVAILCLVGCTSRDSLETPSVIAGSLAWLETAVPALPVHETAALRDFNQLGREKWDSGGCVDEGESLRMSSTPASVCYSYWGFPYARTPGQCTVYLTAAGDNQAYLAISDYSKGTWDFRGTFSGPQVSLDVTADNASPAGTVFILAITYDSASVLIDRVVLTSDIDSFSRDLGDCGGFTSLARVSDYFPAISYYDSINGDLRFITAADPYGSVWNAPITIDSAGDTGRYTSLAIVSKAPAIAYYDATNMVLRYVRAADQLGTVWALPITVDASANCGEYCSLAVVDGYPAISYYDFTSGDLRFVRALDADGAAWDLPSTPDNSGVTGLYTSLEVVNGMPAISYRNASSSQLWYVRATDAIGGAWAAPVLVAGSDSPGFFSSLAVTNGKPAICYYAGSLGDLCYVRAMDANGEMWNTPQTLDDAEDKGSFCAMTTINGIPTIAYHSGLNGDLRLIRAFDSVGDSWDAELVIDESSVITGIEPAIVELLGGITGISYFDQTKGKLMYAWGF